MTTLREAAQQALEALLKSHTCPLLPDDCEEAIAALRAALAAASQWIDVDDRRYEELRALIDGGSESMTHADAIEAVQTWREAYAAPAAPQAERAVAGCERLRAQRDELLYALRTLLSYANVLEMRLLEADGEHRAMQRARAVIKAVKEGK